MQFRSAPALASLAAVSFIVAGCGGSGRPVDVKAPPTRAGKPFRGGHLVVLSTTAPRGIDPASASRALEYEIAYATQRPLFSYRPGSTLPIPDLAAAPAVISGDGRTVTVHVRKGIRFSPPVDREVTSHDVAYAIERGANPSVRCPYFRRYFSALLGASDAHGGPIAGIVTPDDHTIVFHLDWRWGRELADALALPLSAPVPADIARREDRVRLSRYEAHLASTGPYMFATSRAGRIFRVGYVPGRSALLVRNPNWRATTDFRPAYLNSIAYRFKASPGVSGRKVLTGSHLAESLPTLAAAELARREYRGQLAISPYDGVRYIALNNSRGPFRSEALRRALWAALNVAALARISGGPLLAQPATHFLYAGMPGSQVAVTIISPELPYLHHPKGDLAVARAFLKTAGYSDGRYSGRAIVSLLGSNVGADAAIARTTNGTLLELGFHTRLRLVSEAVMRRECGAPSGHVDVCPDGVLHPDFADGQALIYEAFDGSSLSGTESPDWSKVNLPDLNSAIERESKLVDPALREQGFGAMDNGLVNMAIGIPYAWTRGVAIESRDVDGVSDSWNGGDWDLAFSSLKPPSAQ